MLYSEKLKSFQAAHPFETIAVCGAQCRYILSGENIGRTLVFLNGGMNTLEMWMDYVGGTVRRRRVVLFDYRRSAYKSGACCRNVRLFSEARH